MTNSIYTASKYTEYQQLVLTEYIKIITDLEYQQENNIPCEKILFMKELILLISTYYSDINLLNWILDVQNIDVNTPLNNTHISFVNNTGFSIQPILQLTEPDLIVNE